MKTIRKMLTGLLLLTVLTALFSGCNTIEGMGEDLERGGEKIQDAAD